MFRMRYEALVVGRGWDLESSSGEEIDEFDGENSTYLIDTDDRGKVNGSVRLISTKFPTIINEIFPHFCTDEAPRTDLIWESSRGHVGNLCRDPLAWIRLQLAQLEIALLHGVEEVVFVVDTFLLPKWVSAGWNLAPLGPPTEVDGENYIACTITVSPAALRMMRDRYKIQKPVMTYIANVPQVA
jgi:acyl-homoserine lactone synthase